MEPPRKRLLWLQRILCRIGRVLYDLQLGHYRLHYSYHRLAYSSSDAVYSPNKPQAIIGHGLVVAHVYAALFWLDHLPGVGQSQAIQTSSRPATYYG